MATLTFKRGDTIAINGARTDAAGDPVDLSGVDISCEMKRNQDTQAVSTSLSNGGTGGLFTLLISPAASIGLDVGYWLCDVKFDGGGVFTSETFTISVEERITDAS